MTIRNFEYTDDNGIKREAPSYTVDSFIDDFNGQSSPVRTRPDGKLDSSLFPESISSKAASLIITRTAHDEIFAGELVYPMDEGKVYIADDRTTLDRAKVLGLALNRAAMGEDVEVLLLGVAYSPEFAVFETLDMLFLSEDGSITNVRPTNPSKYLVQVGKALGGMEILIDIHLPIVIGG